MKVLMMIAAIFLIGCGSDDVSSSPYIYKCADDVEYREVVELSFTTHQITKNTCNSIEEIVTSSRGSLFNVTKEVKGMFGGDRVIQIFYDTGGFIFKDITGISFQGSRITFSYRYVAGDNFIKKTTSPSGEITYINDDEEQFNSLMNEASFDSVIEMIKEAIPSY